LIDPDRHLCPRESTLPIELPVGKAQKSVLVQMPDVPGREHSMAPWPTWCKRFHLSSSECVEITGGDQALFHLFLCKSLDERRVLHKDMVIKPVYPMQCWMQAACRWIPPVNRKRVPSTTPMRISGKGPLSP